MWKCETCGELLEDQFTECWKCAGAAYHAIHKLTEDRCPFCGAEGLQKGRTTMSGAGFGEGGGAGALCFRSEAGQRIALDSVEGRHSYHCSKCGAVLMSALDEL